MEEKVTGEQNENFGWRKGRGRADITLFEISRHLPTRLLGKKVKVSRYRPGVTKRVPGS